MTKGIVVAGLSGGSGKSVAAVGLVAAYAGQGRKVVPFKKGPDYIDAGWLQLAAGNPCYNLDPYLMESETIRDSFALHSENAAIIIVEGNRGLFDGVNVAGAYSTAELSVELNLPVILVIDCTKTTRTVAALVLGCQNLDPRVMIKGVILNRLGTARHESIVRQSVEHYTDIPVVGAIPRSKTDYFPQRHLGVTPFQEHEGADQTTLMLAEMAEKYLDLKTIENLMADVSFSAKKMLQTTGKPSAKVRIGILKDAAFQFYYPENLEALVDEGAELVEINAMRAPLLPELDGLYIGGGFPETSARRLAENSSFRESVKSAAETGLPIYAECGGLIYLGESILLDDQEYPLAGVFPVRFGLHRKPQAHGYTELVVRNANPFYQKGEMIKGHEFRYSRILSWQGDEENLAFEMKRGVGFMGNRDGLVYKNVLALYTHIHSLATPQWAGNFVARALEFKNQRVTPGLKNTKKH
ncbi:MAG: hydrogenobyrinic acid a,c-diamide synthase (glutamine-hydrolyzing) [Deltaproteobacteria bacterium]|jgi:cobyrinic acid a,c-diamide synthase|nr:hydrogenobyrinic acid a,c-diamide synthase (glutamine-hydrolyzing) [Deltaproteobacteria bacterium]